MKKHGKILIFLCSNIVERTITNHATNEEYIFKHFYSCRKNKIVLRQKFVLYITKVEYCSFIKFKIMIRGSKAHKLNYTCQIANQKLKMCKFNKCSSNFRLMIPKPVNSIALL